MYGLRKIYEDGMHYNFQWPLEVDAVVTAPDWNPEAICGGGLHMLPDAQGDYGLLDGYYWAVVEFDESMMVRIGDDKAKVPECKIVYISKSGDGLLDYFKDVKFNSQSAYEWALYIGDQEHMKQFINEEKYAYWWAYSIGDREYMRSLINSSTWAHNWLTVMDDNEYMQKIIKSN